MSSCCGPTVHVGEVGLYRLYDPDAWDNSITVNHPRCVGAFPELLLSIDLSSAGRRIYPTRFDCQFAWHLSHAHESFSVRV